MWDCDHESRFSLRPEGIAGVTGTRVTGDCELPNMSSGN